MAKTALGKWARGSFGSHVINRIVTKFPIARPDVHLARYSTGINCDIPVESSQAALLYIHWELPSNSGPSNSEGNSELKSAFDLKNVHY